jgi:hypothetical protein
VTSRQLFLETTTHDWLRSHFPNLIAEVHFGNMHGIGPSRKKVDVSYECEQVYEN